MVYVLFGRRRLSAVTGPLDFSQRWQFQLLFAADSSYDYLGQAVAVADASPQAPPWVAIGAPGADYHERGWAESGAVYLISGGVGLLGDWGWGVPAYLVAMGMLLYTAIVSPGYFAQRGQWVWLGIFGVLVVLALASVFAVL